MYLLCHCSGAGVFEVCTLIFPQTDLLSLSVASLPSKYHVAFRSSPQIIKTPRTSCSLHDRRNLHYPRLSLLPDSLQTGSAALDSPTHKAASGPELSVCLDFWSHPTPSISTQRLVLFYLPLVQETHSAASQSPAVTPSTSAWVLLDGFIHTEPLGQFI